MSTISAMPVNEITNTITTQAGQLKQMAAMEMMAKPSASAQATNGAFGGFLKTQLDEVNKQARLAKELRTSFELGDPNVSLVDVMVQSQKSSISFTAAVQMRNKLVSAYQEIMSMSV